MTNQQEQKPGNESKKDNPFGKKPGTPKFNPYWIYGVVIILFIGLQFIDWGSKPEEIYWQQFKTSMLDSGDVDKIEIINETPGRNHN